MHSICQTLRFLNGNQDTSRAPNNNKQPCSCQTSLRNMLFHLVQRISLHFKSPDLYLSCTTKVFPKFLLPFQCQASFQSEQFGSYDYAPRLLSLVACSLSSQGSRMLMQKRPLLAKNSFGIVYDVTHCYNLEGKMCSSILITCLAVSSCILIPYRY